MTANSLLAGLIVQDPTLEPIRKWGEYLAVRRLPDKTVAALGDLMFTRAIYMGCDENGWSHRFCFEDRTLALARFLELKSVSDEPEGFVARRPEVWRR